MYKHTDKPIADQTEYRPPTQLSKPNMFLVSIPNLETSSELVDRATKCFAMSDSFADCKNHFLAVLALVVVSAVVKVLEAMRKRVVSGSESLRASAICVPSMLETKCSFMFLSP